MESTQPVARLRYEEQEYLLFPDQTIRLGRSAENQIVLVDPRVSRSHAMLEWNGSGFNVLDLHSINGTSVNGQRLGNSSVMLRDGDVISICDCVLPYEIIRTEPSVLPKTQSLSDHRADSEPLGAALAVLNGPDKGQQFPLWGECITIGRASRDATWEIRLTDRSVSRPHARLDHLPEGYLLIDLNSANGTLVNGEPLIQPVFLHEGDVILVGETQLVFFTRFV